MKKTEIIKKFENDEIVEIMSKTWMFKNGVFFSSIKNYEFMIKVIEYYNVKDHDIKRHIFKCMKKAYEFSLDSLKYFDKYEYKKKNEHYYILINLNGLFECFKYISEKIKDIKLEQYYNCEYERIEYIYKKTKIPLQKTLLPYVYLKENLNTMKLIKKMGYSFKDIYFDLNKIKFNKELEIIFEEKLDFDYIYENQTLSFRLDLENEVFFHLTEIFGEKKWWKLIVSKLIREIITTETDDEEKDKIIKILDLYKVSEKEFFEEINILIDYKIIFLLIDYYDLTMSNKYIKDYYFNAFYISDEEGYINLSKKLMIKKSDFPPNFESYIKGSRKYNLFKKIISIEYYSKCKKPKKIFGDECSICFDENPDTFSECGHPYHFKCLKKIDFVCCICREKKPIFVESIFREKNLSS